MAKRISPAQDATRMYDELLVKQRIPDTQGRLSRQVLDISRDVFIMSSSDDDDSSFCSSDNGFSSDNIDNYHGDEDPLNDEKKEINLVQTKDDAILNLVNNLAQKAAVAMVSDPVPQHLGNITPEEYKELKEQEAKNFQKAAKFGFWHKKPIHDTIWVQLQQRVEAESSNEDEEGKHRLQDVLVPRHSSRSILEAAEEEKSELEPPKDSLDDEAAANPKPRITFDMVIIRDYGMVLGDHPNCRYGPPVMLDWDYMEYEPLSLDDYEKYRSRRRPLRKLYLHKPKRQQILLDQGLSLREINLATKACKRAQFKRELSISSSQFWHVEHVLQSLGRKLKRLALRRQK